MKPGWPLLTMMAVLLVLTSAITVSSRMWMLASHRELQEHKRKQSELVDQEQALQVELVSRTDMNIIERRARKELGMQPLQPDQWRVLKP